MEKMKPAEIRRKSILQDLMEMECCPYEMLMQKYDMSERTMQMDIKELCKQGYDIKGVKAKQGYVLRSKAPETMRYFESADAQKVRMLFLLLFLQNTKEGLTIEQIMDRLKDLENDDPIADERTIRSTLEDLLGERMVICENGRYVISVNAPIQIPMNTSEAMRLLNLLEVQAVGNAYEETLKQIYRKLMLAMFNEPEEEGAPASAYVVYGRSFRTAGLLEECMEKLNSVPFEKKKLLIHYRSTQGTEQVMTFSVGNVVYSVDKDKLYLIGEAKGSPMILLFDNIEKMEATKEDNRLFQNKFYSEIVDRMFTISVEPVERVVVEFEDEPYIEDAITQLKQNRPYATLERKEGKLIYTDEISGLSDFGSYLRRFGSKCKVLEPKSIRKQLHESAEKLLKNYEREGITYEEK